MTVGKWRNRFIRQRFAGLSDEPRPGVPRTITDAQIEEVVVRTLEEAPEGATHWSKRELARQVGLSPTTIHRIWRAFGLKPWLVEEFKVSTDPFLIDKVRDVVGLYLAPPANAAVFSVDEKPQIQALERTAPVLPMVPGTPERRSHDYERHGTVDLFAALNTATGTVIGKTSAQHAAQDFTAFLDEIDRRVEPDLAVHLICDNLLGLSAQLASSPFPRSISGETRPQNAVSADQPTDRSLGYYRSVTTMSRPGVPWCGRTSASNGAPRKSTGARKGIRRNRLDGGQNTACVGRQCLAAPSDGTFSGADGIS
jgi:transposase